MIRISGKQPDQNTGTHVGGQENNSCRFRVTVEECRSENDQRCCVGKYMRYGTMDQRRPDNALEAIHPKRIDAVLIQVEIENSIDDLNQPQEHSKGCCEDKGSAQIPGVFIWIVRGFGQQSSGKDGLCYLSAEWNCSYFNWLYAPSIERDFSLHRQGRIHRPLGSRAVIQSCLLITQQLMGDKP